MAQLMPLPLTVSCFSKIQVGFTFLVPAHLGSPGKGPLNGCVCGLVRQQDQEIKKQTCTTSEEKQKQNSISSDIPRGLAAITFGLAFEASDGDVLLVLVVPDVVVAAVDFFSGADFL